MRHVPEIKLIRTDTTLDLSQKAEKVCLALGEISHLKKQTETFCCGCTHSMGQVRKIKEAWGDFPASGFFREKLPSRNFAKNAQEKNLVHKSPIGKKKK